MDKKVPRIGSYIDDEEKELIESIENAPDSQYQSIMTDEKKLRLQVMIREGVEEAKKGEFISHEAVEKWVESLGTDNELPLPKPDIFKK